MKKYFIVEIPEVHYNTFMVEAEDKIDALKKMISEDLGDITPMGLNYSHSFDVETWVVSDRDRKIEVLE